MNSTLLPSWVFRDAQPERDIDRDADPDHDGTADADADAGASRMALRDLQDDADALLARERGARDTRSPAPIAATTPTERTMSVEYTRD